MPKMLKNDNNFNHFYSNDNYNHRERERKRDSVYTILMIIVYCTIVSLSFSLFYYDYVCWQHFVYNRWKDVYSQN